MDLDKDIMVAVDRWAMVQSVAAVYDRRVAVADSATELRKRLI